MESHMVEIPEALYGRLYAIGQRHHRDVAEVVQQCFKLGILVDALEGMPNSCVIVQRNDRRRVLRFLDTSTEAVDQ